jgi:hypothetical protein
VSPRISQEPGRRHSTASKFSKMRKRKGLGNSGYALVAAFVAILLLILFGLTYLDVLNRNSSSSNSSTSSTTSSGNVVDVYEITYSGTAEASDSNNPIPIVPGEQCSADYPCDAFLNDSASWSWNYVYYYVAGPSIGPQLSAYDTDESTESMTYSANWVAIPSQSDPAYSCTNSTSVISNTYYAVPNTGAVLGATGGNGSAATGSSTQYAPWNAIGFNCGTYNNEAAPATSACAGSYSDIFNFTIAPGTYPEGGSMTCPSAEPQGAGGFAGGTFSWSGSIAVSQGTCNNIPASTQMLPLLKACLAAESG